MTEHEFEIDTRAEAVADDTFAAAITTSAPVLSSGTPPWIDRIRTRAISRDASC